MSIKLLHYIKYNVQIPFQVSLKDLILLIAYREELAFLVHTAPESSPSHPHK